MGIFDFFKKNKEEPEDRKAEVLILEKLDFSKVDIEKLEDYYDWILNYGERKLNLD